MDLGSHQSVTARVYPADPTSLDAAIILGHGAGAGQDSAFMVNFARALASRGVDAVTFNFPYIEQKRRIPDRAPVLEACFRAVVERVRREVPSAREALFIGGKSMGGRIATQTAAADDGAGSGSMRRRKLRVDRTGPVWSLPVLRQN